MKFLDEDLIFSVTFPSAKSGNFNYTVEIQSNIIFVGQVYIPNRSYVNIDMGDVLRSCQRSSDWVLTDGVHNVENVAEEVTLIITDPSTGVSYYAYEDVVFSYRYPHITIGMNETYEYNVDKPVYQGVRQFTTQPLTPRIPFTSSDKYHFRQMILSSVSPIQINFGGCLTGSANYTNQADVYTGIVDSSREFFRYAILRTPGTSSFMGRLSTGSVSHGDSAWTSAVSGAYSGFRSNGVEFDVWSVNGAGSMVRMISTGVKTRADEGSILVRFEGRKNVEGIRIGDYSNNNYVQIDCKSAGLVDFQNPGFIFELEIKAFDIDAEGGKFSFDSLHMNIVVPDKATASLDSSNLIIADIDCDCINDYYLMWVDRFGGIQSQPIKGKKIFKESITRKMTESYNGYRRDMINDVTPSWQLNTGWLNETIYPYYESILVSPYLFLYDTKNDEEYRVICTDNSYEEKVYKNQKLISMDMKVEISKKQVIMN